MLQGLLCGTYPKSMSITKQDITLSIAFFPFTHPRHHTTRAHPFFMALLI